MTSAGGVMYNIIDQQKYDQLVNKGALLPFNAIVLAWRPLKALPKTFETVSREVGLSRLTQSTT